MKKKCAILSLVLILALACGVIFALVVSAEPASEAKLTVVKADTTEVVYSGTYDAMVEQLNSDIASSVGVAYRLELVSDAVATKSAVISGSGTEAVTVGLAGHKLTADTNQALFDIANVASFALDGGYDIFVERGRIITGKDAPAFKITGTGDAEVGDVVVTATALTDGASAVAVDGGVLALRNVDVV